MTKPRVWTEEDKEVLRQLYCGGQSLEKIAKRFGTTEAAVSQKAYRMGLKRPRRAENPRRNDIASRLRVLLGEEVRPPAARRLFSDEELLRFAGKDPIQEGLPDFEGRVAPWILSQPSGSVEEDGDVRWRRVDAWARLHGLDLFCQEVLGLELMDHQLAMAYCCLASKRALCLAGRQSGKDVAQASLALWEAVTTPNARIVMVSAAQRQSDALMDKVLAFVARNEKLFDSVLRSSREALQLTNGSFVKALPATGLIRGETATRVLVNEARDILGEEEVYSAVEPMLLTTGGFLAIFSTPLGKGGRLWEAYNSPLYAKTQIPSRASRYASPEHLERQRLEMSTARYANEYEAQFLDVANAFFSSESIQRCARDYDLTTEPEPGRTYALGVDWARVRDASVMLVVGRDEDDILRVAHIKAFLNVPMPDQVAYVRWLHDRFRFARVVSEYAGLGIGPTDQLRRDLGRVVDAFKPTAEAKAKAYDHVKSRLERGTLTLPMHPKLLAELRTLEFRLTSSGKMTIHHPGGGSDDYADALMLACWALRTRAGSRVWVAYGPRW
jgi:hypothetical protein